MSLTTVGDELLRGVAGYGLAGSKLELPPSLDDEAWDRLRAQANDQRVAGFLLDALKDGHLGATDERIEQVRADEASSMALAVALERHLLNIGDVLTTADVEWRLLKGPALAHLDYPNASKRSFGDIDLLVREAHYDAACRALLGVGGKRRFAEPKAGFDRRFGKGVCFEMPSGYELDLHRSFVAGPFGLLVQQNDLFANPSEIVLAGRTVKTLGREQRFLHACYHAVLGARPPRLVPLRDIAQILFNPLDLAAVEAITRRWNVDGLVALAISTVWDAFELADSVPLSEWARAGISRPNRNAVCWARTRRRVAVTVPRRRPRSARSPAGATRPPTRARSRSRAATTSPAETASTGIASAVACDWPRRGRGPMSNRPIKVLWVAKGLGRGGAEILLVQALRHLSRDRFEIEVAYVLPWKNALVADFAEQRVPTHCLGGPPFGRLLWPWRLARLARKGGFDLVHTHMPQPAVATRLFAHRRTPLLHTEHNVWPRYRKLTAFANALTYRRNNAVIAVSEGVASSIRRPRWMLPHSLPPVEVIVHGVDSGRVRSGSAAKKSARVTLGLPDDCARGGYRRKLHPQEGPGHAPARDRPAAPDLPKRAPRSHRVRAAGGASPRTRAEPAAPEERRLRRFARRRPRLARRVRRVRA